MTSVTRPAWMPPRPVPPRLIATDLDGTLLHDDHSVSERTVAALAAAEKAGIEVFFVTGRPARWMDVVREHVHGHGLAICGNGAAVVDLHDISGAPRFLKIRPLPDEAALHTVRLLRAAVPGTLFAVERLGGLDTEKGYPPLTFEIPGLIADAETLLTDEEANTRGQVLKILAHHPTQAPDAFLALARTALGAGVTVTRSSPSALLEISGPGVSKASTLELCCTERGISAHEVVAFGDMPNDLDMLTWAGTSYAMQNAHPDVLAAASGHTIGNNDDGVAAVIEDILRHAAA